MSDVNIAEASLNQAHLYRDIRLQALCTDPEVYVDELLPAFDAPTEKWAADIADHNRRVLLAIDDESPDRAVAIQIVNRTRDNRALLHSLYVMPSYRSRGLARRMIKSGIGVAEDEWGANSVYTEVLHTNVRFMQVFESLGFIASGAKIVGRNRYPKPFGEYALTRMPPVTEK